ARLRPKSTKLDAMRNDQITHEQTNIEQINRLAWHQCHHPVVVDVKLRTPRFVRGSFTNGDQAALSHDQITQKPPLKPLEKNCNQKAIWGVADDVIAHEGLPGLQWPISPWHHVGRNRRLRDLDTKLEQLTMDLSSAPERVLKAHSSDQGAH